MIESPDKRLIKILQSLSPAEAQNRLMRVTDRNLAICTLYMEDVQRTILFGRLGRVKRDRVQQELGYVRHLRLRYPQYRAVIEQVILSLAGGKDSGPRSYIRPIKNSDSHFDH
mgnify:CR=1 FL=1